MKTILSIKSQKELLQSTNLNFVHVWSSRGYGNSKLIKPFSGDVVAKASGCGYDRFGTVVGQWIELNFQDELNTLAKRHCKTGTKTRKTSNDLYGLFYNAKTGISYVDGACGDSCMKTILNAIGFTYKRISETSRTNNGEQTYQVSPVTKHEREWLNR